MQFDPAIHTKEFLLNHIDIALNIARKDPEFITSHLANDFDVLKLANEFGWSVAHTLFSHQPEWGHSEAANDKRVLTIEKRGQILAEHISKSTGALKLYTTVQMAVKLISQGAAYKHSKTLDASVGRSIFEKCEALIKESIEPPIALKQAIALYSTCFHCAEHVKSTEYKLLNKSWNELLENSKSCILEILTNYPALWDIDHNVDIFCEPADALLKHLKAEITLTDLVIVEISSSESDDEFTAKSGLY
jgi:hypothetical protein